jgi:hypothetical protein
MSIKCSNCGHVNPWGRLICERCGQKLPQNQKELLSDNTNKTIGNAEMGPSGNVVSPPPPNFGRTILGNQMFPNGETGGNATIDDAAQYSKTLTPNDLAGQTEEKATIGLETADKLTDVCLFNECEYPKIKGLDECPKCGRDLRVNSAVHPPKVKLDNAKLKEGELTVPSEVEDAYDPYREPKYPPNQRLSLILVPRSNESTPVSLDGFSSLQATQAGFRLNREILEPDNRSISNVLQAQLHFVDGKWMLEDRSIHQTTFLLLREPHELKNGDVILMGDRKFTVNIEILTVPGAQDEIDNNAKPLLWT